jgi:hypothetical protein
MTNESVALDFSSVLLFPDSTRLGTLWSGRFFIEIWNFLKIGRDLMKNVKDVLLKTFRQPGMYTQTDVLNDKIRFNFYFPDSRHLDCT